MADEAKAPPVGFRVVIAIRTPNGSELCEVHRIDKAVIDEAYSPDSVIRETLEVMSERVIREFSQVYPDINPSGSKT